MNNQSILCPNCNAEMSGEISAEIKGNSRISIKIISSENEMMDAKSIGGIITSTSKLLEATGDHVGFNAMVLVETIKTEVENGVTTIQVDFIIARDSRPHRKQDEAKI